jgi:hypothetical protein
MHAKALRGRGRKRADWVIALYSELYDEFHKLRCLGVKLSASVLKQVAPQLHKQGSNDTIYGTGLLDPISKKCMNVLVNSSWIERFQVAHGLTVRRSTRKGMLSPDTTKDMHRVVPRHLCELKRQFDSRLLDEAAVENGDETHVMVNMDNGRCLAAIGDADVKYADVVSGGMGMTLFVRLSGGATSVVKPGFVLFQSAGAYPIRGVEDTVPGVSYRVCRKGWMDRKIMAECFGQK